jgi:hypothetical protein
MNDLICNRSLGEEKGDTEQHVICANMKCGERERERVGKEVKRTYRLWTKYRGVNLTVGARSRGVSLAMLAWVVGGDLTAELCLWDGDVRFWCCRERNNSITKTNSTLVGRLSKVHGTLK